MQLSVVSDQLSVRSPEGNSSEDFIAPDFSLGSYVRSWDP